MQEMIREQANILVEEVYLVDASTLLGTPRRRSDLTRAIAGCLAAMRRCRGAETALSTDWWHTLATRVMRSSFHLDTESDPLCLELSEWIPFLDCWIEPSSPAAEVLLKDNWTKLQSCRQGTLRDGLFQQLLQTGWSSRERVRRHAIQAVNAWCRQAGLPATAGTCFLAGIHATGCGADGGVPGRRAGRSEQDDTAAASPDAASRASHRLARGAAPGAPGVSRCASVEARRMLVGASTACRGVTQR
jgi:hypothetical protein